MYKCTECGMEYEIKPDYCDCGNDEFVITIEEKTEPESKEQKAPKEYKQQEEVHNPSPRGRVSEGQEGVFRVAPLSLIVFLICIILSIVIICLPVKENETVIEQIKDTVVSQSIPDIDKFWNNAVPVTEAMKLPVPEPVAVKVVTPVKQEAKLVQKPVSKTVQKPVSKPAQTQKPKLTVVTLQKNPAVSTVEQIKKAEEAKKKAEAEARAKAEENARKLAEVQKHAENLQQAMFDRQELANYKAKLRNTIGRKIDFTKVVGDGDCAISFKIDSNGRLVNGAFAKQSSNITLNDAVYKAFMSSRSFTAPPAGYKNETLKLYVKFYNGNFEISLN